MKKNIFKERLEEAIFKNGISPAELSRRSEIPEASISNYLSGGYKAGNKNISKLSQALNVSPGYLLGIDEVSQPEEKKITLNFSSDYYELDEEQQVDIDKRATDYINFLISQQKEEKLRRLEEYRKKKN